jgi:hypothetical protein
LKRFYLLLVAAVLCGIAAYLRVPTTELSENFDAVKPELTLADAGAFHTLNGTNVDVLGSGLQANLCAAPETGNCLDMGGTGGNPQAVLQTVNAIDLEPGVTYRLSFQLIGSQRGNTTSTTVNFGPYQQTFVLESGDTKSGIVKDAKVTVDAPQSAFLTFTNNTKTEEGALLDNVVVSSTGAESGVTAISLVLVAVGCVVLFFVRPSWLGLAG